MRAIHKIILDGTLQRTNRFATFDVSAPGYPDIDGEEIDFGSLEIGVPVDVVITITNHGDITLPITGVIVTGSIYSIVGVAPTEVLGNTSETVTVRASSISPGTHTGGITISATGHSDVVADFTGYVEADVLPFSASFNSDVYDFDFWDDAGLIVVGNFAVVNGVAHNSCVILTPSGATASTSINFNSGIYACCVVDGGPSGWALVGGGFDTVAGVTRNYLAAVNRDGTHRTGFPNLVLNGSVYDIQKDSQGRILISGGFTSVLGVAHKYLVRILQDGTIDPDWTLQNRTNFMNDIRPHILADDTILLPNPQPPYCNFGVPTPDDSVVLLDENGLYDASFSTTGTSYNTKNVRVDSLGRIYRMSNGTTLGRKIERFSSAGVLDATFTTNIWPGNSAGVNDLAFDEANNRLIVGGQFELVDGDATNKRFVALSLTNGARDTSWFGGVEVANSTVYRVKTRPGDVLWVCGSFTAINGASQRGLAKGSLSTGVILV